MARLLDKAAFVVALIAAVPLASLTMSGCHPPAAESPKRPAVMEFTSIPWGFSTSSYWIEGPTGLVVLDTQFLPSEAERMIAVAEKQTGKKIVLAVVLHANPDKLNGTAVFQKHGIRVVTSKRVKEMIPAVHEKRLKAFYERYAPDYPKDLPAPEVFGDATTEITAGGVAIKLHVMGAGCSEAHVVAEWNKHVFVGDLVGNGVHSWLEIGKTDEWLKRLDEVSALAPERVHPGRGKSGGPELLIEEKAYLDRVIAIVAEEKPTLHVDELAFERAKEKIKAAYPHHGFSVFLDIGLPAEWTRQARLAPR